MEHMAVGRHLLEIQDVATATEGLPLVAMVTGIVAAVAIIVVLALCMCQDKAESGANQAPTFSKTATPVLDQKAQTATTTDTADVTVDVEGASSILRHSANGSAVRDSTESRPKSHDQRALPEIPATSAALTSQTDEDDETDGHYDVISSSRNRRALALTPAKVVAPLAEDEISPIRTHPRPKRPHDYEAVDLDAESLSPYATGQELTFPMYDTKGEDSSEQGSYGTVKNPYATVEGVGNADYAHIEERRDKSGNRDIERLRGLGSASQASIDTLDESYSSVAAPPVPDKNFDEPVSNGTASRASNSPRLPPRNGGAAPPQEGATSIAANLLGGSTADGASGADIAAISAAENGGTSTSGKREPPYSRVTARESLAHLRQREAQALMAAAPVDATYESVDYDLVKMPSAGASSAQPGDRNSLTSDLYAEIAMGENSQRSSVYARVDEVPSNPNAPTPPPVDILKTLSLPPEDLEMGDPGYSVIRRNRPHSVMGPVSESRGVNPTHPVYAKVDWKKKQTRASVHVSENVQSQGAGASGRVDFVNPYAEVKEKKDNSINPYSKIKSRNVKTKVEDPYSEVKGVKSKKSKDVDPYAKVKDVDPYAKVKDVDPYAKVKDVDPYAKVKDVDPYAKIKDTNPYADITTVSNIVPVNGGAANGNHVPDEYRGTGARPKVRENGASAENGDTSPPPSAPRKRFDPGYSTISSVQKEVVDNKGSDNAIGGGADNGSATSSTASPILTAPPMSPPVLMSPILTPPLLTPHNPPPPLDPSYETVAMGTSNGISPIPRTPNGSASNGTYVYSSYNGANGAAVAPPLTPPPNSFTPSAYVYTNGEASSGSGPASPPLGAPNVPSPRAPRGPVREHIYQEISDARLETDKLKRSGANDQSAASSAVQSTAV